MEDVTFTLRVSLDGISKLRLRWKCKLSLQLAGGRDGRQAASATAAQPALTGKQRLVFCSQTNTINFLYSNYFSVLIFELILKGQFYGMREQSINFEMGNSRL